MSDFPEIFQSPPSSVNIGSQPGGGTLIEEAYLWEPDNIICAGKDNQIINGRRCSIINGNGNIIGGGATNDPLSIKRNLGKFNTHILGGNNLTNSSMQDNTFYVGTDLKIDINEAEWECYLHQSVY
ncbi:hypothetical protein EB151_14525, partial [archaeon]|nr:hypothetical protein [archaeon]